MYQQVCRVDHVEGSKAQKVCAVHGNSVLSQKRKEALALLPPTLPFETGPAENFFGRQAVFPRTSDDGLIVFSGADDAVAAASQISTDAEQRGDASIKVKAELLSSSKEDMVSLADASESVSDVLERRAARLAPIVHARDVQKANVAVAEAAHKVLSDSYKGGETEWVDVRLAGDVVLAEYDTLEVFNKAMSEYQAGTASIISIADKNGLLGTLNTISEDALDGHMAPAGKLNGASAFGIGGADVSVITGAGMSNYEAGVAQDELVALKAGLKKREPLDMDDFRHPAVRGLVWEPEILRMVRDSRGWNVVEGGFTFRSTKEGEGDFVANFDGFRVDDDGKPERFIEIKYATSADKWGNPEDGLDGIPPAYRAQAIWYAKRSGLNKGTVAVLIDDTELRVYDFELDDDTMAEAVAMENASRTFWERVEQAREDGFVPERERRKTSIAAGALKPGWTKARDSFLNNVMAFRDQSREEVIAAYDEILAGRDEKSMDPEEIRASLKRLYTDFDLSTRRPIVMVDLEATGLSPVRSHIIETGASVVKARKSTSGAVVLDEIDEVDEIHGLNATAAAGRGTGPEDVHHISLDMVKDKEEFARSAEAKRLLDTMINSGGFWAHNIAYETSMLRQHLPGFAEAMDDGRIRGMDTMKMSQHLDGEKDGVSHALGSVMSRHGLQYVDAHRAKSDVDMQVSAVAAMMAHPH